MLLTIWRCVWGEGAETWKKKPLKEANSLPMQDPKFFNPLILDNINLELSLHIPQKMSMSTIYWYCPTSDSIPQFQSSILRFARLNIKLSC